MPLRISIRRYRSIALHFGRNHDPCICIRRKKLAAIVFYFQRAKDYHGRVVVYLELIAFILPMKLKPRVYLNSIRVESRAEPELLDQYYSEDCAAIRDRIRARLGEFINLPHVATINHTRTSDLALDVLVPRFETGIWAFDTRYRLFHFDPGWQPWLELQARLCRVVSGETISQTSVTAKLSREVDAGRARSLRALLSSQPKFRPRDLDSLVAEGCLQALDRLRISIRPTTT